MPRLSHSTPKYRLHKASGQAVVTLNGRDYYLGPWKSKASKVEYDRLIGEWLANGRCDPNAKASALTVAEMLVLYWDFAKQHYQKDGQPTGELDNMKYSAKVLRLLYGNTRVDEFGPLALKAIQRSMVENDLSRTLINSRVNRIKRIFRWACSEQLVDATIVQALATVQGLQKGRTDVREASPVHPVTAEVVEKTLPYLPPIVADLVRFQWLTGCRPTEACIIRPCDIDRTADVWEYRPGAHKCEHHGRDRVVFLGPKAIEVITPYLLRPDDHYCFSPIEAEKRRRALLSESRTTPIS